MASSSLVIVTIYSYRNIFQTALHQQGEVFWKSLKNWGGGGGGGGGGELNPASTKLTELQESTLWPNLRKRLLDVFFAFAKLGKFVTDSVTLLL